MDNRLFEILTTFYQNAWLWHMWVEYSCPPTKKKIYPLKRTPLCILQLKPRLRGPNINSLDIDLRVKSSAVKIKEDKYSGVRIVGFSRTIFFFRKVERRLKTADIRNNEEKTTHNTYIPYHILISRRVTFTLKPKPSEFHSVCTSAFSLCCPREFIGWIKRRRQTPVWRTATTSTP